MKIYTKTGDEGQTSLFSGGRVRKDDVRVEAYGTVDELVSHLGMLRSEDLPSDVSERLMHVQSSLFEVGSVLADPDRRLSHDPESWRTDALEEWIDVMETRLETLTAFILPGGGRAASLAHVARTVCRRAERRVLALADDRGGVPEGILAYLNRLSDALFVLSRLLNLRDGVPETLWPGRRDGPSSE
jgi:cob(I)alamin adenosyltransferase